MFIQHHQGKVESMWAAFSVCTEHPAETLFNLIFHRHGQEICGINQNSVNLHAHTQTKLEASNGFSLPPIVFLLWHVGGGCSSICAAFCKMIVNIFSFISATGDPATAVIEPA